MTTSNSDLDKYVSQAVQIMASTLGPIVASDLLQAGITKYVAGDGSERHVSTLQSGTDPSDLLLAMVRNWRDGLENRFGHPENLQVRQLLYNVKGIRNYYVGQHRDNPCKYDHHDAIGEIGRLVAAYSEGNAAEGIQFLKRQAGDLMYGQSTLASRLGVEVDKDVVLLPVVMTASGALRHLQNPHRDDGEPHTDEGEMGVSLVVVGSPVSDIHDQIEEQGLSDQDSQSQPGSSDLNEDVSPLVRQPQRATTADFYVRRGDDYLNVKQNDAAMVEYDSAIELDAYSVLAHYGKGRCYARKKDYAQAIASLTKAIDNDPDFAPAYAVRGLVYLIRGEEDSAGSDFDKAIGLDKEEGQAYFGKGRIHLNRREFELATEMYDEAVRLSPDSAQMHRGRGRAYRGIGDMEQAIASFKTVADMQPERVEGWRTLAQACEEARKTEDAIEAYRELVHLNPEDAEAWSELGRLNYNRRNYQDAVDCLQQSADLDPWTAFTNLLLGQAFEAMGNPGQALESYQQAIEIDESGFEAWTAMGRIYAEDGDYGQSAEMLRRATELEPQMAHQLSELGHAFLSIEQYEQAIDSYEAALGMWDMLSALGTIYFVTPDEQVYAWNNLGVAHMDNGDVDQAISCYSQAVELWQQLYQVYGDYTGEQGSLDPSSMSMALNNLVVAFARKGDYSRAIDGLDRAIEVSSDGDNLVQLRDRIVHYRDELAQYDEAIERASGDPVNRCLRALFYRDQEDFESAVADLNKALGLDPTNDLMAEIYNELGLIHVRLEDYGQAMEDYRRAIDNKLDFAEAYYNRGILWRRLGRPSDTLADFDLAIAFNKGYAEAYQNRGYLQLSRGNSKEAQNDFDQARELGFEP